MTRLNQVLAVEKGIRGQHHSTETKSYHALQRPAEFYGFDKHHERRFEEIEDLPPEHKRVQHRVRDQLKQVRLRAVALFDIAAQKDDANCKARADVVVGDQVILADMPATFLLFLEKQLENLKNWVGKIPELDPAETWTYDDNSGLYQTAPTRVARTKKQPKVITKAEPTKEHPAQTELIYVDQVVGDWVTVKKSGAVPPTVRAQWVDRIETLLRAVKRAREAANQVEAPERKTGDAVFDFIFQT